MRFHALIAICALIGLVVAHPFSGPGRCSSGPPSFARLAVSARHCLHVTRRFGSSFSLVCGLCIGSSPGLACGLRSGSSFGLACGLVRIVIRHRSRHPNLGIDLLAADVFIVAVYEGTHNSLSRSGGMLQESLLFVFAMRNHARVRRVDEYC